MKARDPVQPSLPFAIYLILAILLVMAPIICLISIVDYVGVKQELEANAQEFQNQTETGIILSMDLVDTGLKIFDDTLDNKMQEGFEPFLSEYERAGGDPAAMNLSHVREELGEGFDLYVIGASGVIEYTTRTSELGYDFKEVPYFYDRITEIRLGDTFSADRVVPEISSGELRKYAYMPTPDHRYLLELGYTKPELREWRTTLGYKETVQELVDLNLNIDEIRLYDSLGSQIGGSVHSESGHRLSFVRQAYREKTTLWVENTTTGKLTQYLFIDLTDRDYASDMSMVAELTYSTKVIEAKLVDMFDRYVEILLIGLGIIGCLSALAAHYLTRPIRTIVKDVDAVAQGDLDHPIRIGGAREFAHLGESISTMVMSLKGTIRRFQESEEELKSYSDTLVEEVRRRTAALEESNQMVNFCLDIIGHDIKNANNVAGLYSDILFSGLEGEPEAEYLRRVKGGLSESTRIIKGVNIIRDVHERPAKLRSVDLDPVIRSEIEHFSRLNITYAGTDVTVVADDLLGEVFANLIENAWKSGGDDVEIVIRVEVHGDEVEVSVEDTGPGIPDAVKKDLFDRLGEGGRLSGADLRRYVCFILVKHYGGKIWVDDRVRGEPERGVATKFTLSEVGSGGDL